MNITTTHEDGVDTLVLSGRFDAHMVPSFKSTVQPLEQPGATVRVDLAAVRFIDSTALAELLRSRSALLGHGGELILSAVSESVRVILELTGLEAVFSLPAGAAEDRS